MTAKHTDLVPAENFLIANIYDGLDDDMVNELRDQMDDLDADGGIECRKIKVSSGSAQAYQIEGDDPDDPELVKSFQGVMVFTHRVNAYWSTEIGSGGPDANRTPDCSSFDGKTGVDATTGERRSCDTCPMNAFGSDIKGGRGKACKNMRRVYLLRNNDPNLYLLTVPPTSLKEFNRQLTRIMSRGTPYTSLVLNFKLEKDQNAGGIDYAKVAISLEGTLPPETAKRVAEMRRDVKERFGNMAVSGSEYNAPAADGVQEGAFTELDSDDDPADLPF